MGLFMTFAFPLWLYTYVSVYKIGNIYLFLLRGGSQLIENI